MHLALKQRGRASVDFVAAVGGAIGSARRQVTAALERAGVTADTLPRPWDARVAQFESALQSCSPHAAFAALREWTGRNHGAIAIEAFEEIRSEAGALLARFDHGSTTLELAAAPEDVGPDYWRDVAFHRTGAWDGHEFMGAIHGEIVHRRLVARNFGGDIYAQRRGMLDELSQPSYARILELGTSSGNLTVALSQRFPDSEISGVDLSRRMLEHARRVGNAQGFSWRLYQRPAERSGFADGSFDLVTAYALGHEVPAATMEQILREAWRVLCPGGELLLGDVVPFAAQDALTQCWADHDARRGGEPWWRDYSSMDLAGLAGRIGFESVRYTFAKSERRFPYILHAHKAAS
jgi:SAM-dependent methyltransferase